MFYSLNGFEVVQFFSEGVGMGLKSPPVWIGLKEDTPSQIRRIYQTFLWWGNREKCVEGPGNQLKLPRVYA